MIDVESELKELTPEDFYRVYAERLQVWRLCGNASCRWGRCCRGHPFGCCRRFADWAEAVKASAKVERDARDPAADALRSELGGRLRRLAETMRDET